MTGEGIIRDIFFAVGLVIAFEGLLFAALPGMMRRAMEQAAHMPEHVMRVAGVAGAVIGIAVLWLVKAL